MEKKGGRSLCCDLWLWACKRMHALQWNQVGLYSFARMHTYVDKLLAKTFIYITLGWDYILDCIFIISAQTTRAQLNDEERKKRHDNERRSKLIKACDESIKPISLSKGQRVDQSQHSSSALGHPSTLKSKCKRARLPPSLLLACIALHVGPSHRTH